MDNEKRIKRIQRLNSGTTGMSNDFGLREFGGFGRPLIPKQKIEPVVNSIDWKTYQTDKYWPYKIAFKILVQANPGKFEAIKSVEDRARNEADPEYMKAVFLREAFGETACVVEPVHYFARQAKNGFYIPPDLVKYLINRSKLETERMQEERLQKEKKAELTQKQEAPQPVVDVNDDPKEDTTSEPVTSTPPATAQDDDHECEEVERETTDTFNSTLQIPKADSWDEITITLLATDMVEVSCRRKKMKLTYHELGMKDVRKGDQPKAMWWFLVLLIKENGFISRQTEDYNPKMTDTVKGFKRQMKKFFEIDNDVISHYKTNKGYKAFFQVADKTHGSFKDLIRNHDSNFEK